MNAPPAETSSMTLEQAGTLDFGDKLASVHDALASARPVLPSMGKDSEPHDNDEEALEWHEVIELQTFSERKAWIEEKIKVCCGICAVTLRREYSPLVPRTTAASRGVRRPGCGTFLRSGGTWASLSGRLGAMAGGA